MRSRRHRQPRAGTVALLAAAVLPIGPAAFAVAGDICVTCEAPFAIYACSIEGVDGSAAVTPGSHLHCIRELARSGGHARCGVDARSVAACPGTPVRLAAPPPQPIVTLPPRPALPPADPTAPPGQAPVPGPVAGGEAPAQSAAEPPPGEPRTVEELAKRTAQSSKEGLGKATDAVVDAAKTTGQGLEKAGDAVGSAAKTAGNAVGSAAQKAGEAVGSAASKTWRCLTSLFDDC